MPREKRDEPDSACRRAACRSAFAEGLPSIVGGTETAWAGKYSLDGLAQDFAGTGSPQEHDAEVPAVQALSALSTRAMPYMAA